MINITNLLQFGIPVVPADSFANTGFETLTGANNFASWLGEDGGDEILDEAVIVHGGSHAVSITFSWIQKGVYQNIPVTAGEHYTFSFWTRGDGSTGGAYRVYDLNNLADIIPPSSTGIIGTTYTLVSVDFVVPEGCFTAEVKLNGPSIIGTCYFDDASLLLTYPFDITWTTNEDVLQDPPMVWEYGISGIGITDLVADTGILSFYLDNSQWNSANLAGLYSPGHTNVLDDFAEGLFVRIYNSSYVDPYATNLVVNPGFETAGGGGGGPFGTWTEDAEVTDETILIYKGDHSCKIVNTGTWRNISQGITVVASTQYRLSFWTRGDGVVGSRYTVYDNTNAAPIIDAASTGITGTTYTLYTVDFTTPVGCINIEVYLSSSSAAGTVYFDDVSVEIFGATLFTGTIAAIRPTSGLYDAAITEVEVHDWMGYLSTQQIGVFALQTNKTFDEAITTALANFVIQPNDTNFDVGVEEFVTIFNTDNSKMSMASLFSKMCRNEMGRAFVSGNGTLVLENRDARPLATISEFTLNGTMTELDISYEKEDIANIIQAKIFPAEIDTVAVRLWDLNGAPAILPGETLTILCSFTDPSKGGGISATSVVNPVVSPYVEFGSVGDFVSDDMAAYLSQNNTVGGNSMLAKLTNTHPTATGYLNDFQPQGLGIYFNSPIIVESINEDSIAIFGERRFIINLEQISDPNIGHNYAAFIKNQISTSHIRARRIVFLANQSTSIAKGAMEATISQRFTAIESLTGVSTDFHIQKLKYTQMATQLWVDILAIPVEPFQTFIWDAALWDDEATAKWAL